MSRSLGKTAAVAACAWALLLALLGAPCPARAQAVPAAPSGQATPPPAVPSAADRVKAAEHLKKGKGCYDELNYGCARRELEAGIKTAENFELHQYLAYTLIALGEEQAATEHFIRVFELEPRFRLSTKQVSPKIYRVYRIAQRRYEEARQQNLLIESRKKIDEFFGGLVEPIQKQGVSWFGLDLNERWYFEIEAGYSWIVAENIGALSGTSTFQGGFTFGGGFLYGANENLTLGPEVRYSSHRERANPARSLDLLLAGARLRLQEPTDVFLFFLDLSGGAAFTGFDGIKDQIGYYIQPTGGAHAIVTDNLSLGVRAGITIVRRAGVPNNENTFEVPVLFELSYLY